MSTPTSAYQEERRRLLIRQSSLQLERSSWLGQYMDCSRYVLPRAGRFTSTDVNRGTKKNQNIIDSAGTFALRTLAAGMMSGMTSPARPWFRLALADKDLMEHGPVKQWLHDVAELMRAVFAASNTYNSLHACYEELGVFGTWADFVLPDFNNVLHHMPMTAGEYALGANNLGTVDSLVREFRMSVGQVVQQFGLPNCSTVVKNLYDRGTLDAWVPVIHIIEPREFVDTTKKDRKNMPFASIYFEPGSNEGKWLRESGFKRFPALCPRWVVTANDTYGRSPAMEALGDIKQLQHMQMRKAQAIDLKVNPPLQVPTAMKDHANARLPGGVSFYDAQGPGAGVRTAYEVNIDLQHLLLDIQDVRERINRCFYTDLFLMVADDQRSGVTATEIAAKNEEKLIQLGPVLERLQNELLKPLIDITFDRLVEARVPLVLNPPEELAGMDLDIEFVSTLAQAQRAVATGGMDRLLTTVANMAAVWPEARHKIDPLQAVDEYGNAYGVAPSVIVPDDKVAQKLAAEQQQMAAQQAAAAAPVMADAAKTASDVNIDNLRDVMGGLTGYNTPTPGAPAV